MLINELYGCWFVWLGQVSLLPVFMLSFTCICPWNVQEQFLHRVPCEWAQRLIFDRRRFHMEWANQSQNCADDFLKSVTCLQLPCQCLGGWLEKGRRRRLNEHNKFFCLQTHSFYWHQTKTAVILKIETPSAGLSLPPSIPINPASVTRHKKEMCLNVAACVNGDNHEWCLKGYPDT